MWCLGVGFWALGKRCRCLLGEKVEGKRGKGWEEEEEVEFIVSRFWNVSPVSRFVFFLLTFSDFCCIWSFLVSILFLSHCLHLCL
jgi:hypothetical protein